MAINVQGTTVEKTLTPNTNSNQPKEKPLMTQSNKSDPPMAISANAIKSLKFMLSCLTQRLIFVVNTKRKYG